MTGEELSLLDAVKAGYVMADPELLAALEQQNQAGPGNQTYTSVALEDASYKVAGVYDPSTGKTISLQEAVNRGIIDPESGLYKDPVTGEVTPGWSFFFISSIPHSGIHRIF